MFKLIRDNIPELMTANGSVCNHAAVQNNEFFTALLRGKLVEEVNEYLDSPDSLEELADIKLVIEYLIGDRAQEFQRIYDEKLAKVGGFDKKYVGFFADAPTKPSADAQSK
jgi:predicted house-cleaning noncanonical NTP pyrophosphatase (MazG superfamily)